MMFAINMQQIHKIGQYFYAKLEMDDIFNALMIKESKISKQNWCV